jgi:hypothetical protein
MEEHNAPVYEILQAQQTQMTELKEMFKKYAAPPEREGQRGS